MKITCSLHSKLRVIERVKKIKTQESAEIYLKDKFTRMMTGKFKGETVKFGRGTHSNYFIGTHYHKIFYCILEDNIYKIITYFLRDEEKYKKYIRNEVKRIEGLFKL